MEDDIINIYKYEVGSIINNNRSIIYVGNNLEEANYIFENKVNNINDNSKNHIIIFLYDYDKNTNINYYDNRIEIC